MEPVAGVEFTQHGPDEAKKLLDEVCDAYADSYGGMDASGEKASAFRDRSTEALDLPRYGLLIARAGGAVVGFAYGYALPSDTPWWDELSPQAPDGFTAEDGTRTFVLAEIDVRRPWQGRGVGRALHDTMLASRSEQRATLATEPQAEYVRGIYQGWGWTEVGRVPGKSEADFPYYRLSVFPLKSEDSR